MDDNFKWVFWINLVGVLGPFFFWVGWVEHNQEQPNYNLFLTVPTLEGGTDMAIINGELLTEEECSTRQLDWVDFAESLGGYLTCEELKP